MRGRVLFSAGKPLLLTTSAALKLLPCWFVERMYRWSRHFSGRLSVGWRWALAKRLAASVGDNVLIGEHVQIRGWSSLMLGHNVSIHDHCFIDARGGLNIGNDVSIAHQVSILTFEHLWSDPTLPIRDNPVRYAPVNLIGDCWIGCGARVLAGVSIGRRCVVAAGAVVTRDVSSGDIVGGIPARRIGTTQESVVP